jgi:uncharacterized protein with HEPN domain
MVADAADRLVHIKDSIRNIRELLRDKIIEDVERDVVVRAALERFEIISEASRHVPASWRDEFGATVPWRRIANFGNVLRHVYDSVDLPILWSVYQNDLDPLEQAVDRITAAHRSTKS